MNTLKETLENTAKNKDIPGASVAIGTASQTTQSFAVGVESYGGNKATPKTLYDLASLTKVVATLPAILKLASEGELKLDDTVGKFIHNAGWFQSPSLANVSIRSLLTHSSGLPAWKPLFALISERPTGIANVLQTELGRPEKFVYSDLGFITLGAIIERISKLRQDEFVKKYIFEPLGMSQTSYLPLENFDQKTLSIASTEDCPWRNQILKGIVHDENAYCLGQVAGHAGLFGTAEDLALYAKAWLNFDTKIAKEDLMQEAITEQLKQDGNRRGLGWALKGHASFAGPLATQEGYGHTGFTGTSLWLEPYQNYFAVLLTNRVHPSRNCGANILQIRQNFHDEVAKEFI